MAGDSPLLSEDSRRTLTASADGFARAKWVSCLYSKFLEGMKIKGQLINCWLK